MHTIDIVLLDDLHLKAFFTYLENHLAENGKNGIYFLPFTQEQTQTDQNWEEIFRSGMSKKYGAPGWRKVWVAKNEEGRIVGHIDIRAYDKLNTEHRVILGMGIDSNFRNQKIGQQLLTHVINSCKQDANIHWLDLEVLSDNAPAIRIYEKMGFKLLCSVPDMFRFSDRSFGYRSMTLNVAT